MSAGQKGRGLIVMAVRQLRRRGGRTIGLALAVLVASTGFTLLTRSTDASRLETVGTVQAQARSTYDILVRPKGSQSTVERSQGLVQPGFVTGVYGGITLAQWHKIQQTPGVQVAAPIAMVGYVYPALRIPISLGPEWAEKADSVSRIDVTWKTDNGLSSTPSTPHVMYVTSSSLQLNTDALQGQKDPLYFRTAGGQRTPICPDTASSDPRPEETAPFMACYSRTQGGDSDNALGQGYHGYLLTYPLAYVLAAVDPDSEDRLVGLDKSVTSGKGLAGASITYTPAASQQGIPILLGSSVTTDQSATVTVSDLPAAAAQKVLTGDDAADLLRLPIQTSRTQTITAEEAHAQLITEFRTAKPIPGYGNSRRLPGEIQQLAMVGMPTMAGAPRTVALTKPGKPTAADLARRLQYTAPFSDESLARSITTSTKVTESRVDPSTLYLSGVFDPTKLTDVSDLTAQLLSGYSPADTRAADARTRSLLKGGAYLPGVSLGGLVQPPPMMITSLAALPQLEEGGWTASTASAPISAVRIRVAGVTGVDEASRERVRLVAQRVEQATGLQLDVTVGSSTTREAMTLPPGAYGRPQLQLSQSWLKKGVAVAILSAVDKKSLGLFFLVLLVSGLSVTNSTLASVRTRRTELGVLSTLGWTGGQILALVGVELAIVSLAAGLAAALLALAISSVLGTSISPAWASLAVPVATFVVLVAGVVPARRAALATPMDAIRPIVARPRTSATVRSLGRMALTNALRVPSRTLLCLLGILIGTSAFTVLVAIALAFQGAVVGSVLGDAVALQARGADYAAAGATLALAGLGVGNVLYLNIRDRASELATLQALGWTTHSISRVLTIEGAIIGALGAALGALLGVVGVWALTGTISRLVLLASGIAGTAGLLVAVAASLISTRLTRRPTPADLLTE